jgi:hypothetical protein
MSLSRLSILLRRGRPAAGAGVWGGNGLLIARNKMALSAVAALCLVMVQFGVVRLSPSAGPVRVAVPLTIALAPVPLWAYRGRLGVWVIFVGLAANLCVIVANGGLMPMERSTLVSAVGAEQAERYTTGAWIPGSKDVLVGGGEGGRLMALGDSIIVRVGGGGFVASPGDIVIWSGIVILAAEASLAWQRASRRARRIEHIGDATPGVPMAEGGAATQG